MSSVLFDPALVRSVISWLFLDHQQSHIIGFTQFSLPHLGLRCLAAVFGLSSTFLLYHFHLFNWAELGWAQLKLSWAGPTRSDCYSAAASADIFCLNHLFFSTVQLGSILIVQLSSVELGWPHKVWLRSADQLISSFFQFNIFQFSSAQVIFSSSTQLKLISAGPTRSDCGVLISSRHTPVSQPRLSFSPHAHSISCSLREKRRTWWISGYLFPDTSETIYMWNKNHTLLLRFCLFPDLSQVPSSVSSQVPHPTSKPVQLCFDLQIWSEKRLRRWSSTQSAAFLKPVPASDCLLHTKYADLLTLCSISS